MGVPLILAGVEDEHVVQEPAIVAASTMHDEVTMERVHGVSVPRFGPDSLGLYLDPLKEVDLFKVDLPDIVEVQTA